MPPHTSHAAAASAAFSIGDMLKGLLNSQSTKQAARGARIVIFRTADSCSQLVFQEARSFNQGNIPGQRFQLITPQTMIKKTVCYVCILCPLYADLLDGSNGDLDIF